MANPIESAKPRRLRWAAKSKNGCATCKLRKKKCDEMRPICGQCAQVRQTCRRFDDSWSVRGADAAVVPMLPVHVVIGQRPSNPASWVGSTDVRDILYLTPTLANVGFRADTADMLADKTRSGYCGYIFSRGGEMISFANHLAPRAGFDPALDITIKCMAALLREMSCYVLQKSRKRFQPHLQTLAIYTQALQSLKKALNDDKRSRSAEILCATQLLALFECLRGENIQGANHHLAGVTQIIQHRGPELFDTDFAKSLLSSQLPLLSFRALYRQEPSFLANKDWINVLESCVSKETDAEYRRNFTLCYYKNTLELSHPLTECITFFLHTTPDQQLIRHRALLETVKDIRGKMQKDYQELLSYEPPPGPESSGSPDYLWWYLHMNVYRLLRLIFQRFYIGLGGSGDALQVELEAQQGAASILDSYSTGPVTYTQRSCTSIVKPGCHAILETADEWLSFADEADAEVLNGSILGPIVSVALCQRWLLLSGFQGC